MSLSTSAKEGQPPSNDRALTHIIFIMWNSIFGLDICCGVAVKVRSHQEKFQIIFYGEGRGTEKFFGWEGNFQDRLYSLGHFHFLCCLHF